ncbi:MAG: hydantoinase/oxoprolinase family protein [Betaproteobacteria bacterium]|nr:MAG: hydantoinase/oxoprolinase family protein [Betaproteobacteria bacterium]
MRIGIDIGGTFTDLVLADDNGAVVASAKTSTDSLRPERSVSALLHGLQGRVKDRVGYLAHGTTVATNAVLQRSGSRVALICTEGFRDVLELGRLARAPELLYQAAPAMPPPLVRRRDRLEIRERIDHAGNVVRAFDPGAIEAAVSVVQKRGIKSVAVSLLHACVNREHELAIRRSLASRLPEIPVSISSEVLPEVGEFERTSTTVLNAYLVPLVSDYVRRLEAAVHLWNEETLVWVMQSNGGMTSADRASRFPVTLLLSGPSAGVVGGQSVAAELAVDDAITLDMGGTSCDVCLLPGNVPSISSDRQILELPVRLPTVDILTIGAGGGSVAWVDSGGAFHVGPRSAGGTPGPACYGRGGTEPTVTDADLVLGVLGDGQKLGDEVALDAGLARRACELVGKKLGLDGPDTAWGIRKIINAAMAAAVRAITVGKGYDPREFTLIAFGGAGPMHAADIAAELGIASVIIPPIPGCHSAYGLLMSDVAHDYVTPCGRELTLEVQAKLDELFGALEANAVSDLKAEGFPARHRRVRRTVDLRYAGQQATVNVPLPARGGDWVGRLGRRFHALHQHLYGFQAPTEPIEVVNVRVRGTGRINHSAGGGVASGARSGRAPKPSRSRQVMFERNEYVTTPVFARSEIDATTALRGPAIVEQDDSTLVVPPGASLAGDRGHLLLRLA